MMNNNELIKYMTKTISKELVGYGRYQLHRVFDDVLDIMAITINNQWCIYDQALEDRFLKLEKDYGEEWITSVSKIFAELVMFFNEDSDDILGRVFHELELHNTHRGQFFTPYHLSVLMAQVTLNEQKAHDDIKNKGKLTINEPTCGSGGMLLACNQTLKGFKVDCDKVVMVAQDIDQRAVKMCFIQLSLSNINAIIIEGNTLMLECRKQWFTPSYLRNYNKLNKPKRTRRKRPIINKEEL